MISPRRFQIVQGLLMITVIVAAVYFAVVYSRLSRQALSLDSQLKRVWANLEKSRMVTASSDAIDLAGVKDQSVWLESLATRLKAASQGITNRLAFDPVIHEKIKAPFQLFAFQNERQLLIEELGAMAAEKKVTVDPAVAAGFPEYSAEQKRPGLLWGQLAMAHNVLETAMQCQVAAIKSLSVNSPRPVNGDETSAVADELSVNIELSGLSPTISRFLLALALRAEEAKALTLPESAKSKPAFFIDRILIRKDSAEKPDSVKLELRVTTLVYRD